MGRDVLNVYDLSCTSHANKQHVGRIYITITQQYCHKNKIKFTFRGSSASGTSLNSFPKAALPWGIIKF